MNTVQNGKGDHPRNNWGPTWYTGYDAIQWRQPRSTRESPPQGIDENTKPNRENAPDADVRDAADSRPETYMTEDQRKQ